MTGLFKNIETKGNPWGRNNSERRAWIDEARADGIEVPVIGEDATDFSDMEYLFWAAAPVPTTNRAARPPAPWWTCCTRRA